MIQDIKPNIFYNEFNNRSIDYNSRIVIFKDDEVLIKHSDDDYKKIIYPLYGDFNFKKENLVYLFRIDDISYFMSKDDYDLQDKGFKYESMFIFRTSLPKFDAFAGFIAHQLCCWYKDNKFCGRCSAELKHSDYERALVCENCGNVIYPKISPAVIVGVIDSNKLLMTKYAQGYKNYALVAGFNEIGETIERTVEREVMEEVGMKVKNITYYKSQPWGFSSSLLMGFFCEVDGSSTIKLDKNELKEGKWFEREDILDDEIDISLTREMIYKFAREGKDGCVKDYSHAAKAARS